MFLKRKVILLYSVLIIALSACGFQLRGQYEIPETLQFIVIKGEISVQLLDALKQQFTFVGINISDDVDEIPRAYLNLSSEVFKKSINTLAISGQVKDYNLDYSVVFSVSASDELIKQGKDIKIPDQKVNIHQIFTVNQQAILASENEERTVRQEMNNELSRAILFRLQALTKRKKAP